MKVNASSSSRSRLGRTRASSEGAVAFARTALLAAGGLATASCTSPPSASGSRPAPECFYASQVTGFTNGGTDRIYANISRRVTYELTLSPGCSQIDWARNIAVRARGTQRICSGSDAELIVPRASGSGAQVCLIRNIRRLSDAEREAVRSSD